MIHFRLFGFLVVIQPWFFFILAFLGGAFHATSAEQWQHVGLFMLAGFISILIHELGHAFLSRRYGGDPHILLHGMGGLCISGKGSFTPAQRSYIVGAGPLASVLLGLVSKLVLDGMDHGEIGQDFWSIMVRISILWTFLNMLPVMPLDGGQLLDIFFGPTQRKATRILGGTVAVIASLYLLNDTHLYGAILFGILAYENFTGKHSLLTNS